MSEIRVLTRKIVTAKKEHVCDASYWFHRYGSVNELNGDELLMYQAAQADKFKILPGQPYLRITGIHEGELTTFRAKIGMNDICVDHDLYHE